MADLEIIKTFFEKKPVIYQGERGDIKVNLTLLNIGAHGWQGGYDYNFWADLEISRKPIYGPGNGRTSKVAWQPEYFHIDSHNPLKFGGLFENLQEEVGAFVSMLSKRETITNVHSVRRCIYNLEDMVKGDFDSPEFFKQFEER
jgi:hypothetical protein